MLLEIEDVARSTGQSLVVTKARNIDDLEPAFMQLVSAQVGAVLVSNDALFVSLRVQIVALAKRHSLPATYEFREFPAVGGLMSYGPSLAKNSQKVGTYAALILKVLSRVTCLFSNPQHSNWSSMRRQRGPWVSKFPLLSSFALTR